jgi:hypothetical protein
MTARDDRARARAAASPGRAPAAFLRRLALGLLPFLAVASVLLYLLPDRTDALFAWTIDPAMTAMLLGSAYVGGIWFFGATLRTGDWRAVRRGMPAVLVFATLLLVATLSHLDRFHAGHVSFVAWIALYLASPPLVLVAMALHRGADDGSDAPHEHRIARPVRLALGTLGLGGVVVGLALFLAPPALVAAWPWALTPLTAQVVGAVLTLPGVVDLQLLVDGRWSAFRTVFQAQLVSLACIVGAVALRRADLHLSTPGGIAFVVGIGVAAVAYAAVYVHAERRARRPGGDV